jgi:hypothetical protein
VLRLTAALANDEVVLTFEAQADMAYTVQYNTSVPSTNWQTWQHVSASATNRIVRLTHAPALSERLFFRVATAQTP